MIRAGLGLVLAFLLLPAAAGAVDLTFPAQATAATRRDEALGSYALPVGPFADGKVKVLEVEGPVTRIAWRLDTNTLTTLQILAPLRAQLLKLGFAVLYECDTAACGGFDFRYGMEVLPEPDMHVDLGDFRYLAAERPGAKGLQYVSLLVSRSANAGFVQVVQVGADPAAPAPDQPAVQAGEAGSGQTGSGQTGSGQAGTGQPGGVQPGSGAGTGAASGAANAAAAPPVMAQPQDIGQHLLADGAVPLDDLKFDSGSADLAPGDYASLAALADWLKANPGRDVTLVGHTDASGSLDANIALSKKRAASVMDRLTGQYGVSKGQLDAEGVGYLAPRASNLTEAGRERNRRVEAILTSTQ